MRVAAPRRSFDDRAEPPPGTPLQHRRTSIRIFRHSTRRSTGGRMNREQIVTTLLSRGALALIRTIEDVEAGRVRRVHIDRIPGDPAFTRAVVERSEERRVGKE